MHAGHGSEIPLQKVKDDNLPGGVVDPVVEFLLDRLLLDPQILQGAGVGADTLAPDVGVAVHIGAVLALALSVPQDTVFAVFSPFSHSISLLFKRSPDREYYTISGPRLPLQSNRIQTFQVTVK